MTTESIHHARTTPPAVVVPLSLLAHVHRVAGAANHPTLEIGDAASFTEVTIHGMAVATVCVSTHDTFVVFGDDASRERAQEALEAIQARRSGATAPKPTLGPAPVLPPIDTGRWSTEHDADPNHPLTTWVCRDESGAAMGYLDRHGQLLPTMNVPCVRPNRLSHDDMAAAVRIHRARPAS